VQPVSDTQLDLSDFSAHIVDVVDVLHVESVPPFHLHDPVHISFVVFDEQSSAHVNIQLFLVKKLISLN
jgi:hypothetical protein